MADNVAITAGSGTTIGADEVTDGTLGTVKVQYVKLMDGTLDGTSKATVGANGLKVDGSAVTQPVSGTFWQATQPVSGTVTANAGTNLNTSALALDATLTGGTQQTKLTDGTNVANVLKSDGTAAGQNSQMVAGSYLSVPFTTTTVQAVGTTDVGNYKSVSVHITSQGTSSTINFQGSNDNTNWVQVALNTSASSNGSATTSATTASGQVYFGNIPTRYFRINVTGISAGTTAGTIIFSTQPSSQNSLNTTVNTGTSTSSAVPSTAFYMGANNSGNLTGMDAGSTTSDGLSTAKVGLTTLGLGYVYNGTSWDRLRGTSTDGAQVYTKGTATDNGLLASKVIAAASTNATSVKASAGKIYRIDGFNSDTVGYWVKFYNKASAPTVGTDVPVATKFVPAGGGFVIESTLGIPYTTGIALATTLNATDADTTAVTNANKLVINLRYV